MPCNYYYRIKQYEHAEHPNAEANPPLQQNPKPSKETPDNNRKPIHLPHTSHIPHSSTLIRRASKRRQRGRGGRHTRRGGGSVVPLGILRAAGMVGAAGRLAGGVCGAAAGDALVVLLGADEVGDGLAVFGGIGGLAVAADAVVGEGFLSIDVSIRSDGHRLGVKGKAYGVAGVGGGVAGCSGHLEAEEGAGGGLLLAPVGLMKLVWGIGREVGGMVGTSGGGVDVAGVEGEVGLAVGEADHAEDCQRLEETHCACEVGVKVREVREEGSVES